MSKDRGTLINAIGHWNTMLQTRILDDGKADVSTTSNDLTSQNSSCSQEPAPPDGSTSVRSLRDRASLKRSASQIWQHVSEYEMGLVALPATSCRIINNRTRSRCSKKERRQPYSKAESACNRRSSDSIRQSPDIIRQSPGELVRSKMSTASRLLPHDAFSVKTGRVSLYLVDMGFGGNLHGYPSTMCPSPEDHFIRVFEMEQELPVACPTCWSIQRNRF